MFGNMSSTKPTRTEEFVSLVTERVGRFLPLLLTYEGTRQTIAGA
jgi:hypothetical protein